MDRSEHSTVWLLVQNDVALELFLSRRCDRSRLQCRGQCGVIEASSHVELAQALYI